MSRNLRGGVHKYSISRVVTAFMAVMLLLTGCKHEPDDPVLSSIEIRTQPTKTTYMVGEALDTTGMKVYAIYDTGSEALVYDWTTSGFNSTKAAENQEVTVSYTEDDVTKTATFKVTIKAPVTLSEISVTAQPTKKEYYVGDTFDKSGLKVTAKYSDTTTKDVTSSCTFTGFDSSKAVEKQVITVSYKEGNVTKTTTIDVKINAVVLKSISITQKPNKTTYKVGEPLNTDGMVVTATYNSGKLAPVTGWTTSGFDSSKAGTTEVTISYTEGGVTQKTSIKFTVTSDARTVTFDANGGSGSMEKQTFNPGDTQALNECKFSSIDFFFAGWNTKKDGTGTSYDDKDNIKITDDTTLYAQWKLYNILPAGTDGSYGTDATYVEFGYWPQDVVPVDDVETLGLETSTDKVTRGYMEFVKGTDGNYYVKCAEYTRPDSNAKYKDNSNVRMGGAFYRWFKVMPIKWRVVDSDYKDYTKNSIGKLLVAESILTGNIKYYEKTDIRTINEENIYPTNYKYSTIRAYLNGVYESNDTQANTYQGKGFYQTAFGEAAQQAIVTTKVETSSKQASYDGVNGAKEEYDCDPTDDKIFLLSEYEVLNYSKEDYDKESNTRLKEPTDYAKANYSWQEKITDGYNGARYWLRTYYYREDDTGISTSVRVVLYNGSTRVSLYVDSKYGCIVPALCIDLQ